jgi:WD40 repeat protein
MTRVCPLALGLVLLFGIDGRAQENPRPAPLYSAADRAYVGINYSPDGTQLAVSGNEFVQVLDGATLRPVESLKFRGLVDEAVFDPKMRVLVVRGKLIDTLLLDTDTWTGMKLRSRRGGPTFSANPGMEPVPGLTENGPWNGSAERWLKFAEYPLGSCPAAWSADGRWLALANGHEGVRICDTASVWTRSREIVEYPDFSEGLLQHANALVFHRRYLFVGEEHGTITPLALHQWEDLATLRPYEAGTFRKSVTRADHDAFRRHHAHITSLSMTPDGLTIVSAGLDEKVCVWTLDELVAPAPATPEWSVAGHYAALDRDGHRLFVAEEKGIRIYDLEHRRELAWIPVEPRTGRLVRLRVNPTGASVASISCACDDCVPRKGDDVSVASYKSRPKRVHQHGGTLQVWSLPTDRPGLR